MSARPSHRELAERYLVEAEHCLASIRPTMDDITRGMGRAALAQAHATLALGEPLLKVARRDLTPVRPASSDNDEATS